MKEKVKNVAVVAAAGSGSRMKSGVNKQFLLIGDVPVLGYTLLKLSESEIIDEIVIAARESEIPTIHSLIKDYKISKVTNIVPGGKTRQESVFSALKTVDDNSYVFIHDGARPFFSDELLKRLISDAKKWGASAPGITVKDTASVLSEDGCFLETVDRNLLRFIQTPQVFKAGEIKNVHALAKEKELNFTDDCSLYSHFGKRVYITEGEEDNIKITVPEDVSKSEGILEKLKGNF